MWHALILVIIENIHCCQGSKICHHRPSLSIDLLFAILSSSMEGVRKGSRSGSHPMFTIDDWDRCHFIIGHVTVSFLVLELTNVSALQMPSLLIGWNAYSDRWHKWSRYFIPLGQETSAPIRGWGLQMFSFPHNLWSLYNPLF